MKRFIAQTGMGDAIFALPLAMAHEAEGVAAEFYTALPELLNGLTYVKGFKVPPWPSEENLKFDGTRLKYDRYRGSYFDSYYLAHEMKTPLVEAQKMAGERLRAFEAKCDVPYGSYVVAGPPRLPERFKIKGTRGDEGDAIVYAREIECLRAEKFSVLAVGKSETYTSSILADVDLTDVLSFGELIYVVCRAHYVVSQVSFLTALAGCLGTPVIFIKGAREMPDRFQRHVYGVTWEKNLRVEKSLVS